MSRWMSESHGQASVELVALIPLIVAAVLVVLQLMVAGWTYWSVGASARVAARTAHVGGNPEAAARGALPEPLRGSIRVDEVGGGAVRVGARPPSILPSFVSWLTPRIWARSGFGAADG